MEKKLTTDKSHKSYLDRYSGARESNTTPPPPPSPTPPPPPSPFLFCLSTTKSYHSSRKSLFFTKNQGGKSYIIRNSEEHYRLLYFVFKLVSSVIFHFGFLTKTRIGLAYSARNKAVIFENLMHNHVVIVENTHIQLLMRSSKYCA